MKKLLTVMAAIPFLMSCGHQEIKTNNQVSNKQVKVKVKPVEISNKQKTLSYSGTVEASQTIPLSFQSIEKVTAIYVEEGDMVKKGQLLAETDKHRMTSAYQSAVAQYEQAIDARKRLKKVYDAGSLPEIKWVEINTKVSQAEANRDFCKTNLENCKMIAPSDGYIGSKNIEVGMSATQIQSPITVVKIKSVFAKISIPENEIGLFERGQEANIQVSALNNQKYTGKVEKVGVVANRLSRTYDVKIRVENTDLKLKPGMVCEVEVIMSFSEPVLLVPIAAVDRDANNRTFVYTVDPSSKQTIKKFIQLGGIVNNSIAVSSGLDANELVIVVGNQKISNHSKVSW